MAANTLLHRRDALGASRRIWAVAAVLALAAGPASAQGDAGYWRQQGPTTFSCAGVAPSPTIEPACRDAAFLAPPGRVEVVDFDARHVTFHATNVIGGQSYAVTWREEWTVPEFVVPGEVVNVLSKGTVTSVAYPGDWKLAFDVPQVVWNGSGSANFLIDGVLQAEATAGRSMAIVNTVRRAGAGKADTGFMGIGMLAHIQARVPYVWVGGTPPRPSSETAGSPPATAAMPAAPTTVTPGAIVAPPESKRVFFNNNIGAVANGGKVPAFTFEGPVRLTYVLTYHWNGGRGAPGGTVALLRSDGTLYGAWRVTVRGPYWEAAPDVVLPAGRYQLIDSDPSTWAQNAESGGFGMADLRGDRL